MVLNLTIDAHGRFLMLSIIKSNLEKEVPAGFLEDFIHRLPIIYEYWYKFLYESKDLGLYKTQARDLLPHFRRAMVEAFVMDLAKKYGLEAKDRRNAKGNWSGSINYVEVRTDSFLLTVHAVGGPSEMVRPAEHRKSKARSNYPLLYPPHLFPEFYPQLQQTPIYAQLLHGPRHPELSKVGFVSLGFPSPDEPVFTTPTIDLEEYCGIKLYPDSQEEKIEDKAEPQRRKGVQIKEK